MVLNYILVGCPRACITEELHEPSEEKNGILREERDQRPLCGLVWLHNQHNTEYFDSVNPGVISIMNIHFKTEAPDSPFPWRLTTSPGCLSLADISVEW